MIKAAWVASGVVIAGLLVFVSNQGCGDDDNNNSATAGASRKGEACQKTSDCAAGLACLPTGSGSGGTCVVGAFNLTQTAKECAVTECSVPKDCCPPPSSNCTILKQECDEETDAGFSTGTGGVCDQYKLECNCDASKLACVNNLCQTNCSVDADCTTSNGGAITGGSKCLGGTCGQCGTDSDCNPPGSSTTLTCVNAKCQPPCQTDGDCSGFDRCVTGKCVTGGCQTNRECVYASNNVEATCGTDGKCIIPCSTDVECGNPKNYQFFSCIAGQCQFIGCQEDKDCQFYENGNTSVGSSSGFSSSSSSGFVVNSNPNTHIVCRDKPTPTPTTITPQR